MFLSWGDFSEKVWRRGACWVQGRGVECVSFSLSSSDCNRTKLPELSWAASHHLTASNGGDCRASLWAPRPADLSGRSRHRLRHRCCWCCQATAGDPWSAKLPELKLKLVLNSFVSFHVDARGKITSGVEGVADAGHAPLPQTSPDWLLLCESCCRRKWQGSGGWWFRKYTLCFKHFDAACAPANTPHLLPPTPTPSSTPEPGVGSRPSHYTGQTMKEPIYRLSPSQSLLARGCCNVMLVTLGSICIGTD